MDRTRGRDEIEAIKAGLDIVAEAGRYTVLKRRGREYVGLSPFKAERTPSFTVDPARQVFFCFASQQGGDVIDLIAMAENRDRGAVIRDLKGGSFKADTSAVEKRRAALAKAEAADAARRERNMAHAREIYAAASSAGRPCIATYLASRGVDVAALTWLYDDAWGGSLRHADALPYRDDGRILHTGPAMVGPCRPWVVRTSPVVATLRGVHRTWLAPDYRGKAHMPDNRKAKLTLGDVWGCGGWLTTPEETESGHAVVGEGYETTLSVMGVLAKAGRKVVGVSAFSLGNLAGAGVGQGAAHPQIDGKRLPSETPDMARPGLVLGHGIARVTILADADGRDRPSSDALVRRAAAKFKALGLAVRIAWPEAGTDFNDMVKRGGARDVARAVEMAS